MTIVRTSRRHLECDGSFNVRDLGGYSTGDGATVRWDVLFRADALHRSPAATAALGATLGWRTVLDLRTGAEVDQGCFVADGVEVLHLPVLRRPWDPAGLEDQSDAVPFLAARYLDMLDEGPDAFRTAVEVLGSQRRLPAVFHCAAGKDRTGVMAALVLSTLGVSDHDIADDYHLSASAVERMVAWLRQHRPEVVEQMAQHPPAFLECPPAAMHAFLEGVRYRHGSAEGYLRSVGVSDRALDGLRANLLDT